MTHEDAVAIAHDLMPPAARWTYALAYVVFSTCLAGFIAWVGMRFCRPYVSAHQLNWPESARVHYPSRVMLGFSMVFIPFVMGMIGFLLLGWPFADWQKILIGVTAAGAAYLTVASLAGYNRRGMGLRVESPYQWIQSRLSELISWRGWLIPILALGITLPDTLETSTFVMAGAVAVLLAFFGSGGGLFVCRALGLVRPASPRLREIIQRISTELEVPVRYSYEIRWGMANAFAFPLLRAIVVTDVALQVLNDEELEAVCAHEFGHLKEPLVVRASRTLAAVAVLPLVLVKPIMATYGVSGLFVATLAFALPIAALRVMARAMEVRADTLGMSHSATPATYARTLEKIYRAENLPAVTSASSTHPSLFDRMLAAGVEPEFARPNAPSRRQILASLGFSVVFTSLGVLTWFLAPQVFIRGDVRSPFQVYCLQFSAGSDLRHQAWMVEWFAIREYHEGHLSESIRLHRAAGAVDQTSWYYPANLAITLAGVGYCEDAQEALELSMQRWSRLGSTEELPEVILRATEAVDNCDDSQQVRPYREPFA